ncbi:MAG: AMP-binding protein [Chloroflexota bacterium]
MTEEFKFGGEIVWRPSQEHIDNAVLTEFMKKYAIPDFDTLMNRSTEDIEWFTEAIIEFLDIQFYEDYSNVVDLSKGIAWPQWCINGKMNIIHNCLDKYIGTEKEIQTAFIWEGEEGDVVKTTYGELYQQVNQTANALRSLGLGKGDAIGLYMPMIPEIIVAFLAIAKIGGVILPLFSGYGVGAVVTRLADADAQALFTADGFFRRGKAIAMKPTADLAAKQVPTLKHMIVVNRANTQIEMEATRDHWWEDLIPQQSTDAHTEITDAEDTLMIIYTSGTTGSPKGAVHTHCGFPIKAAQDMAFGTDVHEDNLIYWMTDMGWMMGPWLTFGALILGASFFIYDGAPDYPGPNRLWSFVENHKINALGVSPTLIRALIAHGEEPFKKHNLDSLKYFASTGEPWNPDPWMWLFKNVGEEKRPIINYSGGTEISGGIVMGNPLQPLKPASFSGACPGIAADIFNENGESVINQVGELVIKAPWIGMTRGFWKDAQRYEESYWSRWTDTWVHGDWAAKDSDGMWYILGRSDDTIKIAGKRLGPAEVESILVEHPAIIEAGAIGIPHEIKGSELVVFCILSPNSSASNNLKTELINQIVSAMGKPLAPKELFFVSDLPKTRNAKVMRRMVRSAYLGLDLGDTSALVNPEAIEEIQGVK